MRNTRIFVDVPLIEGQRIDLPQAAARHVARVLRLRAGVPLTLFNGRGGEYPARLALIQGDNVTVDVEGHHTIERESPRPLLLLQGVARGERMDLIVQKATELGVSHILPVFTVRSGVQLEGERVSKRQAHWQAIAISACEQCARNRIPQVSAAQTLPAALQELDDLIAALAGAAGAQRYLLDPTAQMSLTHLVSSLPRDNTPVALLIGPEGGLEDSEIHLAKRLSFTGVQLGPRILRTETAALAALAAIQSVAGDYA